VALYLDRASSVAMAMSWAGVGWLVESLRGGVGLGGQQDGVHPLGVGDSVGGRSRREGREFWQSGLGLLLLPSMPTR
jgi:hypothetical protein